MEEAESRGDSSSPMSRTKHAETWKGLGTTTTSNFATGGVELCLGYSDGCGGGSMLAYDYPLGGVFLSMLYFFLFFIWIWILFTVFVDIFRSPT